MFSDQMGVTCDELTLKFSSTLREIQNKVYIEYVSMRLSVPHLELKPNTWHALWGAIRKGLRGPKLGQPNTP